MHKEESHEREKVSLQHLATFDGIRHTDEDGNQYWLGRELAPLLEYTQWRNFMQVVGKAKLACQQSGNQAIDHFADISKMVEIGSGAQREVEDIQLSRYACYLIVQNGDPAKPVIANDQTYFALQTRRQELAANLFRATQTEEKLRRDDVRDKTQANRTHHDVGRKVRQTIEELGGSMPEHLPVPDSSIQQLEAAKKKQLKTKPEP